ncbi:MAG: multiheme c-type cytochrome [Bacillota bacterium]|nr:multiheme c-type cytochrome [Bacillota bacterium]MDW7683090.1 multiheme c-type cytochrome [Bacillota bacterium]
MCRTTKGFLFFTLVIALIAFTGCGKEETPATATPEPVSKQDVASTEFDPAGQCQYCHLDIYQQWQGSMHALSFNNPVFQAEFKKTSGETDGAADAFCASCHTPVGWLANEVPPADGSALSDVAREGVTCDLCHAVTEITGVGNAAIHVSPGEVKFGSLEDPLATPLHKSEFNQVYTQSEYCGACHDIVHPQNGLKLSSTYSEWEESSFGSRKTQCQDCHMTPGPGVSKPNPGVVATGAPKKREHTWTHYMTGSNVYAMRQAGFDNHADLAEEKLQAAASMFLGLPDGLSPYQGARINVRVRNDGAGHYLPTGLTLYKEMWLEVIVTDGQGQVVFQGGVPDASGALPADSIVYKTVFADAAGNETTNLWEATKIIRDHRIPPQEYVDEFIEIPGLPLPGTLNVNVRLLYRSVAPGRAGVTESPVVEMASVSGQVAVR